MFWFEEVLRASGSKEKICQLLSLVMSSLPPEQQKTCARIHLGTFFPYFKSNPALWIRYKTFWGEEDEIRDFLCELFQNEDEMFFNLLSYESDNRFVYGVLEKAYVQFPNVSLISQEKYMVFFRNPAKVSSWLLSVLTENEERFFEALSFVQNVYPQERATRFVRNKLLSQILSTSPTMSPGFSSRYRLHMGLDEDIRKDLSELVPDHEDRFLQNFAFIYEGLAAEEKQAFAYNVLEQILPCLNKTSSLWGKYKRYLGADQEIQDWMIRLFREREELFTQLITLESDSSLVCDLLRQLLPEISNASEVFWSCMDPILQRHVSKTKSWKTIGIRSLMECTLPPKLLRILIRKSGLVQGEKIGVQAAQFPKLLPSPEKEWIFALKTSALFKNSSYVYDLLQKTIPDSFLDELRNHFDGPNEFYDVFQDLINQGQISTAISFLECQKRAWGLKAVLPWHVKLFDLAESPIVATICKQAAEEVLHTTDNPWSLYAIFATIPSIVPVIESVLTKDPADLTAAEKNACLEALLVRIPVLISEDRLEEALRFASYLPALQATEQQSSSLLITLFEKSSRREDLQKIAGLMHELTPSLTKNLIDHFRRPYVVKRGQLLISPQFSVPKWILALLYQVQDPSCFSLFVEHLGKFVAESPEESLALASKYARECSENEKESLALVCTQVSLALMPIAQQIFDIIAPDQWSRTCPMSRIWKFVQNGSLSIERKQQFVATALERMPKYLEEAAFLADMFSYMDEISQSKFLQKSRHEVTALLENLETALKSSVKKRTQLSLGNIGVEPFVSMICQNISLYERVVALALNHLDKLGQKDVQSLAVLLQQAPEGISSEGLELRKRAGILCMQKLKSFSLFSWLSQDLLLETENSSLQEAFQQVRLSDSKALGLLLSQIASIPKTPALLQFLQRNLRGVSSMDIAGLAACSSWVQQNISSPMEEDVFKVGQELVLLCLRSKQVPLANEVMKFLYQDLERRLSIEQFYSRYLPLLSALCHEHPKCIQVEHIQKLGYWISGKAAWQDGPLLDQSARDLISLSARMKMLQACMTGLYPSVESGVHSLERQMLLYKNYLALIEQFSEQDCKGINLAFLEPIKDSLLGMQELFTDPILPSCASDIMTIYMKAGNLDKAKDWIQKWMSLSDVSLDSDEQFQKFYYHNWSFLRFLSRSYPDLVEESIWIQSLEYVQARGLRFPCPLLSQCRSDGIFMASLLNPKFAQQIVQLLMPSLESVNSDKSILNVLSSEILGPLLLLPEGKKFPLGGDFFEPIMRYLLSKKEQMPLDKDVNECLRLLALLSKFHRYKVSEALDLLCLPLDAETQGVLEIDLIQKYYLPVLLAVAKDGPSDISHRQLQDLVQYIIRMNDRHTGTEVAKLSRHLVSICAQCGYLDLARSLVEQVHKKRMLQFSIEKQAIDISEDLECYLGYLVVSENGAQDRIFSADEFIQILREHKTRAITEGVPTFPQIIDVFTHRVEQIWKGGRANPALFYIIATTAKFLLDEEPISKQVLQLVNVAYHCPWADFCFYTFMTLHNRLLQKMDEQGFTERNVPGSQYLLPLHMVMVKTCQNFQESRFVDAKDILFPPVAHFLFVYYSLYRQSSKSDPDKFFRNQIVKGFQKICEERPHWLQKCIYDILRSYPDAMRDIQAFIRDMDIPFERRENILTFLRLGGDFRWQF